MRIYFKDVKGIIHEMIQQAKLAYDQGYIHYMWDHLFHDCTCTYTIKVVNCCRQLNYHVSLIFCCLRLSDVYFIISILTGNAYNNR